MSAQTRALIEPRRQGIKHWRATSNWKTPRSKPAGAQPCSVFHLARSPSSKGQSRWSIEQDMTLYSRFTCGDMLLGFEVADDGLEMRLVMVPSSRAEILDRLDGMSAPATAREQLVQVALSGETGPGNRSLGRSMMHGSTTAALRFVHQQVQSSAEATSIETELQAEGLLDVTHKLTWSRGDRALRAGTAIKNVSDRELNLTMAASFCLSGLSPFSPSAPLATLSSTECEVPGARRRNW
jgi:hypothetical protein